MRPQTEATVLQGFTCKSPGAPTAVRGTLMLLLLLAPSTAFISLRFRGRGIHRLLSSPPS